MSKTWFITGASRGIGAEIVKAALTAGDNVVAAMRNPSPSPPDGEQLLTVRLDVSQPEQITQALAAASARFGRIDILVNNAGYGELGLFEEIPPQMAEQQFVTNVFGLFNVTRAVLPLMRAQRGGMIFNLSSIGGMVGGAGASLYCSSKFAVEGFSESLAAEVAQFNIAVTLIEPGYFRTDFLDDRSVRFAAASIDDYRALSQQFTDGMQQRSHRQAGDPKKLADAILQLAASERPPIRFLAGSDAVEVAENKIATLSQELAAYRQLSISTDGEF